MTARELREIRLRLRLTQLELALKLGVAENSVWRWESGRHPIAERTAMAVRSLETKKR